MTQLTTPRLTLRQWRLDDFEPFAAFLVDGAANRHRGSGIALSRDESWAHLCGIVGQWPLRGYSQFALEETASKKLVGWAGLWHPIQLDEPELAWSLFSESQGNGFATEAATRIMRWAAVDLGLPPLFSFVHPDNTPSRKLAERLGATLEDSIVFRGQPRLIYRHRDLNSTNSNQSNQPEEELTCQS